LLALTPAGFEARFGGSAVARAGRDQMVRNACIAAANGGQADCAPLLIGLLDDASAIVRGHAAWALRRLGAGETERTSRFQREPDETVRKELENAPH
jgi:epoxyqueuosine reductase